MAHVAKKSQDGSTPIVVKFWGVRGSFPTGDARIGGHTSCLTLTFPGQLVILDTGSGMIDLGNALLKDTLADGTTVADVEVFMKLWISQPGNKVEHLGRALQDRFGARNGGVRATVIFSHVHGDHLFGIQAFKPVFRPDTKLHMIGATHDGLTIPEIMERFVFAPPVFPVRWEWLNSQRTHQQIKPFDRFTIPCAEGGDIQVEMMPMNHPNRAYGYRFKWNGRVIAVTMDHEHGHVFDESIVRLAKDADLWITEAQYTDAQYVRCTGYGHVSESAAAQHAKAARPGLIYTTHHDPDADFDTVRQIARTIERASGVETRAALQGADVYV